MSAFGLVLFNVFPIFLVNNRSILTFGSFCELYLDTLTKSMLNSACSGMQLALKMSP